MATKMSRRQMLRTAAAGAVAAGYGNYAAAATKTVKIGLIAPQTGPLAIFSEQIPWTIEQIKKATGDKITIGGTTYPLEIVLRDSQSNPNRASEVAKNLILRDKVDLMTCFATPETVNPVADQCELSGVPCLSNDAPLEPYFFGRGGDPKKGFEWTYHFFFSATNLADSYFAAWEQVPTNKVIGALWPNDNDGQAFSKIFTALAVKKGYKVVDPEVGLICRRATTMPRLRHLRPETSRLFPGSCRRQNTLPSPAPPRSRISGRRSCRSPRPPNFLLPSSRLANGHGGFPLRCGGPRPIPTSQALPERRRSNLRMRTKQRAANNGLCPWASVIRFSKSRSTSSSGLRTSTSRPPSGTPSLRRTTRPSLGLSALKRVRSRIPAARR
jgi:Periplasmic binding protein